MKFRMRSTFLAWKWIVFSGILFLLFLLQGIPGFLTVFGFSPNLLIPYVVSFSLFEREKEASIMGLAAGALMDLYSQRLFGFSSILLIICCVGISLLVAYLIKPNLGNAVLLCAGSLFLYDGIEFFLYDFMWGYAHLGARLLYHYLPSFLYTLVVLIPIFYLVRFLNGKFQRALL